MANSMDITEQYERAVRSNNTDLLESLLRKKSRSIDIDQKIIAGCTGLHWAVNNRNSSMVELLIRYGANAKLKSKQGDSCLHLAVQAGDLAVLSSLLKQAVRLNELNKLKLAPLHLAARQGRCDMVLLLLNNKAKVNIRNNVGESPLFEAVKSQNFDLINCLLEHGADPNLTNNTGDSAFHASFELCDENVIEVFLRHNASVVLKNWEGKNALHLAARYSSVKVVEKLIKLNAKCNETTISHETALHMALKFNDNSNEMVLDIIKLLIRSGCDVNLLDNAKRAPLFYAVKNMDLATVECLLESGAQISGEGNDRCVSAALENCDVEMIQFLINRGAKFNAKCSSATWPIIFSFGRTRSLELFKLLVSKGMNIDERDCCNNTALHAALYCQNLLVFKFLIDQGALVKSKNNDLKSPLYTAVKNNWFRPAVTLVKLGACVNDCDARKNSILSLAVASRNVKMAKMLLANGADPNDTSTLLQAGKLSDVEVMKCLVSSGVVIDPRKSSTAHLIFLQAVRDGSEEMVSYLLSNGADINMERNNSVALAHARRRDIIGVLVKHTALMLSLNQQVNQANIDIIMSKEWTSDYFDECKREISIMKKTPDYSDSSFTFYNIMAKKNNALANCVRDKYVKVKLEIALDAVLFPKYSYKLEENYLYGVQRLKIIDEFEGTLHDLFGAVLPYEVICLVSDYFSNEDLLIARSSLNSIKFEKKLNS